MTSHFLALSAVRLKQPLNNLVPEIRRSRLGGVAGTSRASADDVALALPMAQAVAVAGRFSHGYKDKLETVS